MASFPTSIPSTHTFSSSQYLSNMGGTGHISLHQGLEGEVIAIAKKIGTGSSTPTNGTFLVGNGTGTSTWRAATKSDVGLSNVDNTSDATKNSATATLENKTVSTGSVIDANVDVTEVLKKVYPIGSIYIAVVSTNPATLLGFGTWSAFAAGRTLVGLNSGDTDFDTVEETGGSKTNTHNHWQSVSFDGSGLYVSTTGNTPRSRVISINHMNAIGAGNTTSNTREDSTYDETISVVQPYIVTYMWKRTA